VSDPIPAVAEKLRKLRKNPDAVSYARREILPYTRRVLDALGALRALVTDDSPTSQLESDLRVVHGIVAALVGGAKATQVIESRPTIRELVATDVASSFDKDPSATSYGEVVAVDRLDLAVPAGHRRQQVTHRRDGETGMGVRLRDGAPGRGDVVAIQPGGANRAPRRDES